MALESKKLSTYPDLASGEIDSTSKIVVISGAIPVNKNLSLANFIEDTLVSDSIYKPLSAKQGKALKTLADEKMSLTGVNTISGDNTFNGFTGFNSAINTQSDVAFNSTVNTQIVKVTGLTKVVDMSLASSVLVPFPTLASHACPYGIVDDRVPKPVVTTDRMFLIANDDNTASWGTSVADIVVTNSANFSGASTVTAPTVISTDNDTTVATTAFVQAQKNNPTFTGVTSGIRKNVSTKNTSITLVSSDDIVIPSGAGTALTLPSAVGISGKEYTIKNGLISSFKALMTCTGNGNTFTTSGDVTTMNLITGDKIQVVGDVNVYTIISASGTSISVSSVISFPSSSEFYIYHHIRTVSSQIIDGLASSLTLTTSNEKVTIVSDGQNWLTI